jgi:hypothetical protein
MHDVLHDNAAGSYENRLLCDAALPDTASSKDFTRDESISGGNRECDRPVCSRPSDFPAPPRDQAGDVPNGDADNAYEQKEQTGKLYRLYGSDHFLSQREEYQTHFHLYAAKSR